MSLLRRIFPRTIALAGTGKPAPQIRSVSPTTGVKEGDTITLTGKHFTAYGASGTTLTVDGGAVTPTVVSNSSITFPAPAFLASSPELVLENSNGVETIPAAYAYADPTLVSLTPDNGTSAGGTSVALVGTNFKTGMLVKVNGTTSGSVVVASATSATWTTGAHAVGAVDVAVSVDGVLSNTLLGGYTYT